MKQIIQNYKTGKVSLEDVPVPQCGRKSILVRNCHSLISIGTEKATIELGKKSLLGKARARPDLVKRVIEKAKNEGILKTFSEAMGRLDTPTPLGYSAAGVVVEVGIEAHGFAPGDRVACIGQGFASHADYISVPVNLAVKLPETVSTELAAFSMLGCIALHGIRTANLTFGSSVAVIGLGLLGQLTVQLLKAYGCTVFAFDINAEKTGLAEKNGATFANHDAESFENKVAAHTKDEGVDAVIITAATQSSEPVDFAIKLSRQKGKIVIVGVADIHPNRNELWLKEIELVVSKAAGPGSLMESYEKDGVDYPIELARWSENRNLQEFIRLIDCKLIDLSSLITQKYPIAEAEKVYDAFLENKINNPIGMLFEYPNSPDIERRLTLKASAKKNKTNINVSVVGAGLYGKAIFLPALQKMKNVSLNTLVTSSGVSANHNAKRFGFSACATDINVVFSGSETDALIALTPHSQHANLIIKAIENNKSLLIEKPLCIDQTELNKISDAYHHAAEKPLIMIGHNRRYSPHSVRMQAWLKNRVNPAVMSFRINAGKIPAEHWVHADREGRSRIVGEMTHFIDLMLYLLDEKPISVFAFRVAGDDKSIINNDNLVATIQFDRGSVASLVYASEGNRSFNREYLEIFFDEKIITSTDFRVSELMSGKKSEKFKTSGQALGHSEEINTFINYASGEKNNYSVENEFITMQTAFAIENALASKSAQSPERQRVESIDEEKNRSGQQSL
ncbi:MAG: bi-domain-containing oxidoreductase [Gammaproteobacteria bacterium]|nr:bi-domain-containing oxidoreductase [Gammaproteobacteria bacterium]